MTFWLHPSQPVITSMFSHRPFLPGRLPVFKYRYSYTQLLIPESASQILSLVDSQQLLVLLAQRYLNHEVNCAISLLIMGGKGEYITEPPGKKRPILFIPGYTASKIKYLNFDVWDGSLITGTGGYTMGKLRV